MVSMALLPYFFDLAGTFVFAISGAMAGVKHRTDLFGVLVLSFAAANTGGITATTRWPDHAQRDLPAIGDEDPVLHDASGAILKRT